MRPCSASAWRGLISRFWHLCDTQPSGNVRLSECMRVQGGLRMERWGGRGEGGGGKLKRTRGRHRRCLKYQPAPCEHLCSNVCPCYQLYPNYRGTCPEGDSIVMDDDSPLIHLDSYVNICIRYPHLMSLWAGSFPITFNCQCHKAHTTTTTHHCTGSGLQIAVAFMQVFLWIHVSLVSN